MWTDLSSVLSQYTRVRDRRTEFSSLYRVCITDDKLCGNNYRPIGLSVLSMCSKIIVKYLAVYNAF